MKVYTRCERCKKEQEPTYRAGYGPSEPPQGWSEIEYHLFCSACLPAVRDIMLDAVRRSLETP